MSASSLTSVALCGSGLALWMSAAALSRSLPDSVAITVIETETNPASDIFYGHVLPPEAYNFHLSIGLSEPELLLKTGTSFIYGTQMQNWGQPGRSWVQAFHQPLPVWDGVPLARLIQQIPRASLQSSLISVQAVKKGVFANPPEDPAHPLSRAEYGYAVDAVQITALYKAIAMRRNIGVTVDAIQEITREGDVITTIELASGQTINADLFIDCTGPSAQLVKAAASSSPRTRAVAAVFSRKTNTPLGAPAQRVSSSDEGWRSDVNLRSGSSRLTVTGAAPKDASEATTFHIGHTDQAWTGNTIAIGHAASVLEPFTVAPMKLLLRDIDRIQKLLPVSPDMRIEAREYNRSARDDYDHASLFNQAHFAVPDLPDTPYWQSAAAQNDAPKLTRKLTQYNSRGHMVAYDHEPFDEVDWAVLHDGMGRRPRRADPLASTIDPAIVQTRLDALNATIQAVIGKMPPHSIYMSKFITYLQRKYSRNG